MLMRGMMGVARPALAVQARGKYDMAVLKHFHDPAHSGNMDHAKKHVGTGIHGSVACGDLARIQIDFDDDTGLIRDAKFKTFGCASAIAASDYACSRLIGKDLNQVLEVRNVTIASALKLPPVKKHCSLLTEGCIRKAVLDLVKKRPDLQERINPDLRAELELSHA